MSSPSEHKTVQARILAYAEAIGWTLVSEEKKVIRDWRLEIGDSKKDLHSESLSSLCSLRFFLSEFRGFDRRERRDRKEDFDWSIWQQAAAKFQGWEFWHRLCQNRRLASNYFCDSVSQNLHIV